MTQVKRPIEETACVSGKKPRLITEFFSSATSNGPRDESSIDEKNTANDDVSPLNSIQLLKGEASNKKNFTSSEPENTPSKNIIPKIINEEVSHVNKTVEIENSALLPSNDSDPSIRFDKDAWVSSLSQEERSLLALEIDTLHITWLAFLHKELTKPYFLKLKSFLQSQKEKTIFPLAKDIYSWSHLTPLPHVKCLVLGQDPYHNFNQAHGLAFSVLEPTKPPPSLVNIYKALKIDFPNFEIPNPNQLAKEGRPGGGNLTKWAQRGVLMLNACLTVEAHKANSHANKGWEQFTEKIIETAIAYARNENKQGFVIMAWGTPAQKRVAKFSHQLSKKDVEFFVIKSVHPSPLSAHRGFFESHVFQKCNSWLKEHGKDTINWGLIEGNEVY